MMYIATRTHGLLNGNDIDLCCARKQSVMPTKFIECRPTRLMLFSFAFADACAGAVRLCATGIR